MAEVPSIVYWLEEYARLGVVGASIGSNDLTQLVLGVDRDNETLAPLFDERDRAVTETIRQIIAECRRLELRSSICGQAPSVHPEYAETLVRFGIDSISVTPDVVDQTRYNIAAAEQRLVLEMRLRTTQPSREVPSPGMNVERGAAAPGGVQRSMTHPTTTGMEFRTNGERAAW
jgi:pyruvate, water dikinase